MVKRIVRMSMTKKSRLEIEHGEIVKRLQTTFGPLPDTTSLAQPLPFKTVPTVVIYSAYEEPILG